MVGDPSLYKKLAAFCRVVVKATPSAVLITAGKISTPLAEGPDAIRDLVARSTLPAPVKKGEAVPALQLPDLDGGTQDLGALRGRRTLVLFWSPSCGYCQQMIEDVKKLERERTPDAPELLIISSGTAEANREQGFRSPVLLDRIFGAGSVLGAGGTPSAVIIDEQGVVASEVGVGAPAVLALASATSS
jgi:peroxiredoxin